MLPLRWCFIRQSLITESLHWYSIKWKRKIWTSLVLQLDTADERFKALYENPHFNIDPSAPEFKNTENMKLLVAEKVKKSGKRLKNKSGNDNDDSVDKRQRLEVEPKRQEQSIDSLVKSVKSKAKRLENTKKTKHKLPKLTSWYFAFSVTNQI